MTRPVAAGAALLFTTILAGCGANGQASGANHPASTLSPRSTTSAKASSPSSSPSTRPSSARGRTASATSVWARAHVPADWVRTCIPRSDDYVTLTVPTHRPTVLVQIGHPLTPQGVGIPLYDWHFPAQAGTATVVLPTDVAFTMHSNGFLMADVVYAHGRLRLLFWGSETATPVLRGGPLSPSALGTWSLTTMSAKAPALQATLHRDEHMGWSHRINAVHDVQLVGIGQDAWLSLPLDQSFDLFQPNGMGGNVIFQVDGVSHQTPSAYAPLRDACRVPRIGSAGAKPASGQAAIDQALGVVAKTTTVPLWAPEASAIHAPGLKGYLSASTTSAANQYSVTLTATARAYPVNDPKIQSTTGLGQLIGIFGGQRYESAAAAQGALYTRNVLPLPVALPSQVALTPKITADEWRQRTGIIPQGIIEWHQDGWTVQMNQTLDVKLARILANQLTRTALPAKHGVIAVGVAGDGAHTTVSWRLGPVVYQTFSEYLPSTAVGMAASLHPVSGHKHRP